MTPTAPGSDIEWDKFWPTKVEFQSAHSHKYEVERAPTLQTDARVILWDTERHEVSRVEIELDNPKTRQAATLRTPPNRPGASLECQTNELPDLKGTVILGGVRFSLDAASTIDRLIWDKMVIRGKATSCETLTLFTDDVQFDLYLFYHKSRKECEKQCAYFRNGSQQDFTKHAEYWLAVAPEVWKDGLIPNEEGESMLADSLRRNLSQSLPWLPASMFEQNVGPARGLSGAAAALVVDQDAAWQAVIARQAYQHRSCLVVWNFYALGDPIEYHPPEQGGAAKKATFQRCHAVTFDMARSLFQTQPIPHDFLFETVNEMKSWCAGAQEIAADPIESRFPIRAAALYAKCIKRFEQKIGRGSPMQRNLLTLSSLLADPSLKTALITGEPGTGKEAFARALYYNDRAAKPEASEEQFIQLTAPELEVKERSIVFLQGYSPSDTVYPQRAGPKDIIRWMLTKDGPAPKKACIFIDELNKAKPEILGQMLRLLEQGKATLDLHNEPRFILAASEHIDTLALIPPQDFWTRVSHQLRVAHPLSRVSEEDAVAFLDGFFYWIWWKNVKDVIDGVAGSDRDDLLRLLFCDPEDLKSRNIASLLKSRVAPRPTRLCRMVRDEFVNTLVPLVSRDTLSVRGAYSIVGQIFSRIQWNSRFRKTGSHSGNQHEKEEIARHVNSAVQDVLAILNAARNTPANTR